MASKTEIQWKVYYRLASRKRWMYHAIYETRATARDAMRRLRAGIALPIVTKAVKYVRGGGR